MNLHKFAGFVILLISGLWLSGGIGLDLAPDEMNYHDFAETESALQTLDAVQPVRQAGNDRLFL